MFGGIIPSDIDIVWCNRLSCAAGSALFSKDEHGRISAIIKLSVKVGTHRLIRLIIFIYFTLRTELGRILLVMSFI